MRYLTFVLLLVVIFVGCDRSKEPSSLHHQTDDTAALHVPAGAPLSPPENKDFPTAPERNDAETNMSLAPSDMEEPGTPPDDSLSISVDENAIAITYVVPASAQIEPGEFPKVAVALIPADRTSSELDVILGPEKRPPASVRFNPRATYAKVLLELADQTESNFVGYRAQFTSQDKSDVLAPFRDGVKLHLPINEPTDDFALKEEFRWLKSNGFSWEALGTDVRVSAALVATKPGGESLPAVQRIVGSIVTRTFKLPR